MSYTSGFFDAVDQGGGDYDRVYSAASFAHYFSLLVKNGVFPNPSTGLQVKASSNPDMHVSVQPGSGWINGYYITVDDDAAELLTVPIANASLGRIDSVIMGLNYIERSIQIYIKSGAVSASPIPVTLQRNSSLYEMELAQISVPAGIASITQARITDKRTDSSRCGIVAGTIDQIDTTDLFAQYDSAFQTWFEGIQSQLSGDVATNLQNQINVLKSDKVNVSDKATSSDMGAGTDNSKWVTPLLVKKAADPLVALKIGDIYTSINDLEEKTDGKFIQLDGRAVDLDSGYPNLKNTILVSNVPYPQTMTTSTSASSVGYVAALDGVVFFICGRPSYTLKRCGTDGTVTTIAGDYVAVIASANNIIAFTGRGDGTKAVVINKAGAIIRTVTLNTEGSYMRAVYNFNGRILIWIGTDSDYNYIFYSDDDFVTHHISSLDGTALPKKVYATINVEQEHTLFSPIQKVDSDLYWIFSQSSATSIFKSTDNGATFTTLVTIAKQIQKIMIYNGFAYALEDDTSNTSNSVFAKYNLQTGSKIGTSKGFMSGVNGGSSGELCGYIHDGSLYFIHWAGQYVLNLDTLSLQTYQFLSSESSSSYPAKMLITSDQQFFIHSAGSNSSGIDSYEPSTTKYFGIHIVHIPSGKALYLTQPFDVGSSSSESNHDKSQFCEDADGNIYFCTGAYSSGYKNTGVYKFNMKTKKLPSIKYAYLKVEEVTL